MCRGLRHLISIVALVAAMLTCGVVTAADADTAGTVHYVGSADSSFDVFTADPSLEAQAWLRAHMWRMLVWSPYFDARTSWYPQGWVYDDSYAIYNGSQLAAQHPEWILKDANGNRLYIPYGCGDGTCPQYAGDISNPAFRHYWIEQAREKLAHGYRGLFVDDVNMEERVGDAAEEAVTPVGLAGAISPTAWRAYMAEFMAEIRAAFPAIEIVHNVIWFANDDAGISDPSIRREIESANYVMLERGVNDNGLTGGEGRWSLDALLSLVDQVHSLGRGVVLAGAASEQPGMEYNLASYFEISDGNDAVGSSGQTPANWWSGFEVNLGEAVDVRHLWNGLLRRDFTNGMALVNPPGAPTLTVTLPGSMRNTAGSLVSTVTLAPASGAVLTGAVAASDRAVVTGPAEASTQTTVEARVVHAPKGAIGLQASPPQRGTGLRRKARRHVRRHHQRAHARGARGRAHAARVVHAPTALLAQIAGVVRHATCGSVVISIQRLNKGRWLAVARLSVGVSAAGRFVSLTRLHAGSRYRVSATYTGASGYRPSWSGYRLLVPQAR